MRESQLPGDPEQSTRPLALPGEQTTSRRRQRTPRSESASAWRRLVVLCALVVAISAPTFLIGGGPAWAQVAAVVGAWVAVAVAVTTRAHALRVVPFTTVGALAVLASAFQLIPLPTRWVQKLSEQAVSLRAAASVTGTAPSFIPLTLDVPATVIEVCKGLAYLGLFVLTAAVARRSGGARRVLLSLAVLGGLASACALVHRFFGAQTIYGLYQIKEPAGRGFFAPFVNGNQMASLIVLTSLIGVGLSVQVTGLARRVTMTCVALGLIVLPMTGARAAFVSLAIGGVALGAWLLARRFGGAKAALISMCVVMVVGAGTLFVNESLRRRFMGATVPLLDNQKTRGWRDAAALIADYRWTGVGRGAFEAPITAYRSASEGVRLSHPESMPLQLLSEWGLPVVALLLVLTVVSLVRIVPRLRQLEASVQGAAVALAAVAMQELANLSLELTGVGIPTIAALGVVVGRCQERRDPQRRESRKIGLLPASITLGMWGLALGAAVWAAPRTLLADGERGRRLIGRDAKAGAVIAEAIERHPADSYLALLAHLEARQHDGERAERQLSRALRLFPADGILHQALARQLVGLGRPAEAALSFRRAAELGTATPPSELLAALGSQRVAEAVPQTYTGLMEAARLLVEQQQGADAAVAGARAVGVSDTKERAAVAWVSLAGRLSDGRYVKQAAQELLLVAQNPSSFVTAASAFAAAGDTAAADKAIGRGIKRHPKHGGLVLEGTRMQMERGDLAAAEALIRHPNSSQFPLQEQIQLQQLKATLLEKQGDLVGAVTARARARLMLGAAGRDR